MIKDKIILSIKWIFYHFLLLFEPFLEKKIIVTTYLNTREIIIYTNIILFNNRYKINEYKITPMEYFINSTHEIKNDLIKILRKKYKLTNKDIIYKTI